MTRAEILMTENHAKSNSENMNGRLLDLMVERIIDHAFWLNYLLSVAKCLI